MQQAIRRFAPWFVASLALLLVVPAFAQNTSGGLSGTVVDPTGAVVVGADVTMRNEASQDVRRSKTNADGFFAFAALPPATYTVVIETPGFAKWEQRGVQLRVGDNRTLRTVKLAVAGLQEEVVTTANIDLTPLSSGEKSATLTAEQITNMSTISRNAAELLKVLPGMTPVTTGTQNRPGFTGEVVGINGNGEGGGGSNNQSPIGNYSGNGAATEALDITIDGAPGADPGCNCATSVNPNPEMTQEFKVLQANFGAEHAKGPVAMSVVSKSGGRDFHGTLYTYLRNYRMNSNEWFANKVEKERVKNEFLYPGFNLSGPILIPGTNFNKNRDKFFFFLGFEYFKQKLDTGFVKSWVPTADMRNGNFSQAANLGLSGSNINTVPNLPGGIVPQNQIDPGGQVLMNNFPAPNANPGASGGYNYVDNLLVDQNGSQLLARVDWNISENTKLFVRYNRQREVQPWVIGLWWRNGERQLPYPSTISGKNQSDSVTTSLTHVFNPTLTNEAVFGLTYINFPNVIDEPNKVSRSALGYPYGGVFGDSPGQVPNVDPGGWGNSGPIIYNPGGFDPILFAEKWQISVQDNLTKVAGTHTMKFGGYYEYVTNNQPGSGNSPGLALGATWAGNSTGNTFADLLMGTAVQYEEQSKNVLHNMGYHIAEGYAQDSWKIKPRLTVDYGLRVSYLGPWFDREAIGMATWSQERYNQEYASGAQFPGISWNAKDSSVPMSGTKNTPIYVTPRVGFAYDVRGTGSTVVRGGVGMYRYHEPQSIYAGLLDFPAGVRSTTICCGTTLTAIEGIGGGSAVFNGNSIDQNDGKQPVSYSWSMTLNQRLPWAMNVELGYVGNKADQLRNEGVANYNPVPLGAMYNDQDGDANRYRPYKPYGSINVYRHSLYTNYNAFQLLLSRQRGRFNFTMAYTFSKALGVRGSGNGPATTPEYLLDQRSYNYGVLQNDRTHVATATYSYLLPAMKEKNVFVRGLLGGWQLTGISTFIDGGPLQLNNGSLNFSMTGTYANGESIDAISVTGTPDLLAMPILTCDPSKNVPSGYLINPNCFSAPQPYAAGQAGVNGQYIMPYMKSQTYMNHDLSVFKNFAINDKGHKLQLRLSAYNVLNHPISYADPSKNLTLRYDRGVLTNAEDFGRLPEDNKFGRRIVQVALRYMF